MRLQALGGWRGWRIEARSTLCPHVDAEGHGCPGDSARCTVELKPANGMGMFAARAAAELILLRSSVRPYCWMYFGSIWLTFSIAESRCVPLVPT